MVKGLRILKICLFTRILHVMNIKVTIQYEKHQNVRFLCLAYFLFEVSTVLSNCRLVNEIVASDCVVNNGEVAAKPLQQS